MRQLLYVSESLIGADADELDRVMLQSRNNNAIDGLTGLLWTDGARFAQVLEGDHGAIEELMAKIVADTRHKDIAIVQDGVVDARQFGGWSMARPALEPLALDHETRMRRQLSHAGGALRETFEQIIVGSHPHAA